MVTSPLYDGRKKTLDRRPPQPPQGFLSRFGVSMYSAQKKFKCLLPPLGGGGYAKARIRL